LTLGRIAYRLGKLDEAKAALETAVKLDAEEGLAHHLLGLTLWEAGERDEAARHFATAIACKRPHAEAGYFVALRCIAAGDSAGAAGALAALVKAKPELVRPRLLLAATLAKLGRHEEAQRLAAALEAEDPASVEVAEATARCFPHDAARRRAMTQLLKHNPEADEALRRLRAAMDRGEWTHPKRPEKHEHVGSHGRLEREW
jgi:tetratricopeptide (TPR) repeat protein